MIRISCTNCKTILSIDDAFAGGVCRCQHCGTIQTVPSQSRGNATIGASGQSIGGSKSLYQNSEPQAAGTGLDDLASIVVSSGLASSRLTRSARTADEKSARHHLLLPMLLGSGILVMILVFVIIYLLSRNAAPVSSTGGGPSQTTASLTQTPAVAGPNFCGVALTGNTVIYLMDCGSSSQNFIGELKDATIKSAGSLTADRKFAILFWNDGKEGAYPDNTTAYATKDSITSAEKAIDEVTAFGQTDIQTSLKLALAQHPDEIVIATGKGIDLDNAWLDNVLALRGTSPVKIDTFSLGSDAESAPLKRLAAQTGGTYRELTKAQLRSFGQ